MTRRGAAIVLSLALTGVVVGAPATLAAEPPGPVYAEWEWAEAGEASIHPGVQTVVEGAQCTSNFVFIQVEEVKGVEYLTDVLLGYAGHCAASTGNANECLDQAYPVGHPVTVRGAQHQSTVAYNASLTMRRIGETDSDTCFNNDFGLVRLHRDDWANVNPSLPVFGGPLGFNTTGTARATTCSPGATRACASASRRPTRSAGCRSAPTAVGGTTTSTQ